MLSVLFSCFLIFPLQNQNPTPASFYEIQPVEEDPIDEEVQYYASVWDEIQEQVQNETLLTTEEILSDTEPIDWELNLDSEPEADLYYSPSSPDYSLRDLTQENRFDIGALFHDLSDMDFSDLD